MISKGVRISEGVRISKGVRIGKGVSVRKVLEKKKARPTEYLLTGADPTYIDIVVPRRKSIMYANAHYKLYIIHYQRRRPIMNYEL